ncbi:hypothetical protein QQ045_030829 [Rhodiola kirilowii]
MVVMGKDEEMALFFEMRRREAEDDSLPALEYSDELDGSNPGVSPISKRVHSLHVPSMDADDFLNCEIDSTDYDWLLTPPDIPLFPLLEMESHKHIYGQIETTTVQPTPRSTKPADIQEDPNSGLKASAPDLGPAKAGNKIQSISKKQISTKGKIAASKPSRSSTPNSRAPVPSTKPKNPSTRSSTPSRSASCLYTPTGRPSAPVASKSAPRSSTPIRKESSSSVGPCVSEPSEQSSVVAKFSPSKSKNPVNVRGKVPIVKSSIAKPPEALDSLDPPLYSRTSLPERPASASRGRSGASNLKIASSRASSNGKQRQKSRSPSRARAQNISGFNSRNFISAWNRAHSNDADKVNPVIIGSQMVERVVNMRKLAPPKPDGHCDQNKSTGKSSLSRDSSGFGLSLSKKSLDMAIRHMGIRGGVSGNLKPLNTKKAAVSGHSTPTGSIQSSTTNISDSPFATSSDSSSDPTANFNSNHSGRNEI